MVRKYSPAALAAIGALALAGCAAAPESGSDNAGGASNAKEFKACMVSDQGGFDDKSFNESGMIGLQRAEKELGVTLGQTESKSPADFKPNVDTLLAQKCNLIIGVGFMLNDAIRDAAKANPDVEFALVDSRFTEDNDVVELKNAKPIVFNTAEAAYLAGYVSAAVSKSGTVSAYGGMQIPSVNIFMDGFADGIAKYNEDSGKTVKLIGWDKDAQNGSFVGNFEDQSKGKQLTEQQISQGSDIVMPVAGPVGKGTLSAAEGKNVLVVGVDSDWAEMYPDSSSMILTSVVKKIDQAVFDTVKEARDGKFTSEAYVGNLENQGVDIAPFHDLDAQVTAEIKDKVKSLKEDIIAGKIKVESKNNP